LIYKAFLKQGLKALLYPSRSTAPLLSIGSPVRSERYARYKLGAFLSGVNIGWGRGSHQYRSRSSSIPPRSNQVHEGGQDKQSESELTPRSSVKNSPDNHRNLALLPSRRIGGVVAPSLKLLLPLTVKIIPRQSSIFPRIRTSRAELCF